MKSTLLTIVLLVVSTFALISCASQPTQTASTTTTEKSTTKKPLDNGNGLASYLH